MSYLSTDPSAVAAAARRALAAFLALAMIAAAVLVAAPLARASQTAAVSTVPAGAVWDFYSDFSSTQNPASDRYANDDVWHYLRVDDKTTQTRTYVALDGQGTHSSCTTLKFWQVAGAASPALPHIGTHTSTAACGAVPAESGFVHPFHGGLVVVGWQSPITGTVTVSGSVTDLDSGGDGVDWSIDEGSTTLVSGTVSGASTSFHDATNASALRDVSVSTGDFLYFVVGPKDHDTSDATRLEVTIVETGESSFNVNSTADKVDETPGDGICYTGTTVNNASSQPIAECTLRAAVMEANALAGADTITLPSGTYVLDISGTLEDAAATGDLDVTSELAIVGGGARTTVIDANAIDRVIHVVPSGNLKVSGVTITGGRAVAGGATGGGGVLNQGSLALSDSIVSGNTLAAEPYGGGIRNSAGTLLVERTLISDNMAGYGGGIYINAGITTLRDITVSGNAASMQGGGIRIEAGGTTTIERAAVTGNMAAAGPGLYITEWFSRPTVDLKNVTISGNTTTGGATNTGGLHVLRGSVTTTNVTVTANSPGGIFLQGGQPAVTATNALVAGNTGWDCRQTDGSKITLAGPNLIEVADPTCQTDGDTSLLIVQDPLLKPLGDNGGATHTHRLDAGSPALDAGSSGCPAIDQRGAARPYDGDGDDVAACDIGAFELTLPEVAYAFDGFDAAYAEQSATLTITPAVADNLAINDSTKLQLRATLVEPGETSTPVQGQDFTFQPGQSDTRSASDWSFTTGSDGTALLGPAAGFTLIDLPGLLDQAGLDFGYTSTFPLGSYTLSVELLDVTDAQNPVVLGDAGEVSFFVNHDYWDACSNSVTTGCISAFEVDVDGAAGNGTFGAPPEGVSLDVWNDGLVQIQALYSGSSDGYDLLASGSPLTAASEVRVSLNVGNFDPVDFTATGEILSYSHSPDATNGNTVTFVAKPGASSWAYEDCTIGACGDATKKADVDYAGMLIAAVGDMPIPEGLTQAEQDDFAAFRAASRGSWIATNAQAFSSPYHDHDTEAFSFDVAAPHLKSDGTTTNNGFFTAYMPDALLTYLGVADPASISANHLVTTRTDGDQTAGVTPTVTRADGGAVVELAQFDYSSPTFGIAAATVPGVPTNVTAVAGNGQVTVTWAAPTSDGGSAITGYTVTAAPGGHTATVTDGTSHTLTGLTNGTTYTIEVAATNAVGDSTTAATTGTPATVPDAPTGLQATRGGSGELELSWTAPGSDGGSPITGYTVTAAPGGHTATVTDGTSHTLTGLTNGTTYTIEVAATNAVGDSTTAATTGTPATVPGAPAAPTATAGNAQATVTWTAPAGDGGLPITSYTVTVSPGGRHIVVDGATTSTTVTDLINGTVYSFTVLATNGIGDGPASPASASVTPTAPVSGGGGGGGGGSSPSPAPSPTPSPSPAPAPGTASGSVTGADDLVTTDPDGTGPTVEQPLVTGVRSHVAGEVTIAQERVSVDTDPDDGLVHLDLVVDITAPPADSVEEPLELDFQLDASVLPAGTDPASLVVERNGVAVAVCTGPAGHAVPDPCGTVTTTAAGGLSVTVYTTAASRWTFAQREPVVGCVVTRGFTDVPGSSVHADAIACAVEAGLTSGYGDGTYRPTVAVTRGQMAAFVARLIRAAGGDLPAGPHRFVDVPVGAAHAADVDALAAAGIAEGVSATIFRPTVPVTRAQAASLLVRAWVHVTGQPLAAGDDRFVDDDGSPHEAAIDAAAAAGFANGQTLDRFEPARPVRRDQMASLLTRVLDRLVADGEAAPPAE